MPTASLDELGGAPGRALPSALGRGTGPTLTLVVTERELRALVNGGRLLGLSIGQLLQQALAEQASSPGVERWLRPFSRSEELVAVPVRLGRAFVQHAETQGLVLGVAPETFIVARAFELLRGHATRSAEFARAVPVPPAGPPWRPDASGIPLA